MFFLLNGKKLILFPLQKRGQTNTRKLSSSVVITFICGKILERLMSNEMFNEMFHFFVGNKLISSNQSGFKPDDSCINQLLSITHEINLLMPEYWKIY